MNFDALVHLLGKEGWFDLPSLVQLSGERREGLRVQLQRWCKSGKLLSLRRGMYAFPDRYRGGPLNPAELANRLYAPSYLSMHWALGYFGLIPERVVTFTSATTRVPRTFENAFGTFRYRNVKRAAFFGYGPVVIDGRRVLIAEPEKALLDLWHLEKGRWDADRMAEMRFQGIELVDVGKLERYAARFRSPRLGMAVRAWVALAGSEAEGVVTL